MRKLFLTAALSFAGAFSAAAQVGSPVSPSGDYVGPFGVVADGGIPVFAQTVVRPASTFNYLQSFSFFLGDNSPDESGLGLSFRGAVYEVNGNHLGNQLYLSGLQAGSGNYTGFDTYTFSTTNLFLTSTVSTFALVLQAEGSGNGALNVLATGYTDYSGGALYVLNGNGDLAPAIDGTSDAAFAADFTESQTPEPLSLVLTGSGLVLVGVFTRRRRAIGRGNLQLQ